MRSSRYLNTILTILAVLLSLHLWTSWTGGPSMAGAAPDDQGITFASEAYAQGIPNAASQRKQMIDLLKQMNSKTDALVSLFKSGQARVHVENPGGSGKD